MPDYLCRKYFQFDMKCLIKAYLLGAILVLCSCTEYAASPYVPSSDGQSPDFENMKHLTTHSIISDVLTHPAFKGFSRYVLPLEWGYDENMPLSDVARLLPYHNYIDAERCVGYINQMIDSVAAGRKIFLRSGARGCRIVLFPWTAWGPIRGYLSRRRILVCRLYPRRFSPRTGPEPDGL